MRAVPACPNCRRLDLVVVRAARDRGATLCCKHCGRETDEPICVFTDSPPGPGRYPWPRPVGSDAEWQRLWGADIETLGPLERLAEVRRLEDALAYAPAGELDGQVQLGDRWMSWREWVAGRLAALGILGGATARPTQAGSHQAPEEGWEFTRPKGQAADA